MAFNRYINGFDNCKPPVCVEDINIDIINIACSADETLNVEWTVTDLYNRNLKSNILEWKCDSPIFDNLVRPINNSQPYKASIDVSDCDGLIYLRVKVRIDKTIVESEISIFDSDLCGSLDNFSVRAAWCDNEGVSPDYFVYVKLSSITSTPFVFIYDDECWEIENLDELTNEDDIPEGSFVIDVSDNLGTCEDCLEQLGCPAEWAELPVDAQSFEDESIGRFYFEYQTYYVPDRIFIVKNFDSEDCDPEDPNKLPDNEDVLFDTGCVSTNIENTPQFFVSNPVCSEMGNDRPTYGFCIDVRESDLPLGVVIDCACGEISQGGQKATTWWKICVVGPEGDQDFFEGSNECLCEGIDITGPAVIGTAWIEVSSDFESLNQIWSLVVSDNKRSPFLFCFSNSRNTKSLSGFIMFFLID